MNLQYKTKDVEIPPTLQEYAEKKLESIAKLLDEENTEALCELELSRTTMHQKKGDVFYAEANISIEGKLYRATATGETLEAAIDELKDELHKELRRDKRKEIRFIKEGGAKIKALIKGINVGKIKKFRGFGKRRS